MYSFVRAVAKRARRNVRHAEYERVICGKPRSHSLDFRYFGISVFRYFGISVFRCFGVAVFRYFGISVFRCFGVSLSRSLIVVRAAHARLHTFACALFR